jgi:hypothetical protein
MSYRVLTVIVLRPLGPVFTSEYRVMYEAKRTDIQHTLSKGSVNHLTYGHTLTCF